MSAGLLVSSGQAASPAEILAEILAELQKEYDAILEASSIATLFY